MHLLKKYGGNTNYRRKAEPHVRSLSPSLISAQKILKNHLASSSEQGLEMTVLFGKVMSAL